MLSVSSLCVVRSELAVLQHHAVLCQVLQLISLLSNYTVVSSSSVYVVQSSWPATVIMILLVLVVSSKWTLLCPPYSALDWECITKV